MRGNIRKEPTDAVEKAKREHAEGCELRLAKLTNTPKEKLNTPWPTAKVEKGC